MTQFFDIFSTDAIDTHLLFVGLLDALVTQDELLLARGLAPVNRASIKEVNAIWDRFRADLNRLALTTGLSFDRLAKRNLFPLKRGETHGLPGLFRSIRSRPASTGVAEGLPVGAVGLADIAVLDLARNQHTPGYGPYWEAVEFGTGNVNDLGHMIPTQVGRVFRGYFYDAGGKTGATRPLAALRGVGKAPVFIPASVKAGARGGRGGLGRIHHEVPAKLFLTRAVAVGFAEYERGAQEIASRAAKSLSRLL